MYLYRNLLPWSLSPSVPALHYRAVVTSTVTLSQVNSSCSPSVVVGRETTQSDNTILPLPDSPGPGGQDRMQISRHLIPPPPQPPFSKTPSTTINPRLGEASVTDMVFAAEKSTTRHQVASSSVKVIFLLCIQISRNY